MAERLDIVVFGATGFTGKLTAEYLAARAPKEVTLGLAGRSRTKLEDLRRSIAKATDRPNALIDACVDDPSSLRAMARATRIIATTVGPYELYGEPVVAA